MSPFKLSVNNMFKTTHHSESFMQTFFTKKKKKKWNKSVKGSRLQLFLFKMLWNSSLKTLLYNLNYFVQSAIHYIFHHIQKVFTNQCSK